MTAMLEWTKKSVSKARRKAAKSDRRGSSVTIQHIPKRTGMLKVPRITSKILHPKVLFPKIAMPAAMKAFERNGCSRLQLSA